MDNIYILADTIILYRIGDKLKSVRLKQNITQQSLAEEANVSLSTIKKMEKGEKISQENLIYITEKWIKPRKQLCGNVRRGNITTREEIECIEENFS